MYLADKITASPCFHSSLTCSSSSLAMRAYAGGRCRGSSRQHAVIRARCVCASEWHPSVNGLRLFMCSGQQIKLATSATYPCLERKTSTHANTHHARWAVIWNGGTTAVDGDVEDDLHSKQHHALQLVVMKQQQVRAPSCQIKHKPIIFSTLFMHTHVPETNSPSRLLLVASQPRAPPLPVLLTKSRCCCSDADWQQAQVDWEGHSAQPTEDDQSRTRR